MRRRWDRRQWGDPRFPLRFLSNLWKTENHGQYTILQRGSRSQTGDHPRIMNSNHNNLKNNENGLRNDYLVQNLGNRGREGDHQVNGVVPSTQTPLHPTTETAVQETKVTKHTKRHPWLRKDSSEHNIKVKGDSPHHVSLWLVSWTCTSRTSVTPSPTGSTN